MSLFRTRTAAVFGIDAQLIDILLYQIAILRRERAAAESFFDFLESCFQVGLA